MNQKIDLILELAGEKIGIAIPPEPDLSLYVKKDELVDNIDKHKHVIADIDQLPEFRDEAIESYSRLDRKIDANKSECDRHVEEFRTHRHSANDIDNLPEGVNVGNLPGQAATSDGTAGILEFAARNDHTHPAQTSVSGNAGSATKLATSRTITLSGDCTGSTSFDGTENVTITTTVLNGGVQLGNSAGQAAGTASPGAASTAARSDHVHPIQTTVSGNAGSATKLLTARTITLSGAISGSTSFDGSGNVTLTTTSNIAGLQLGNTVPLADGTASTGTASTAARSDHVHPKQASQDHWFGTAAELPDQRSDDVLYYVTG